MRQPKPDDGATAAQVQARATVALGEARRYRHCQDCRCGAHDGRYCTPGDGLWTRALDRELDRLAELMTTQSEVARDERRQQRDAEQQGRRRRRSAGR